MDSRKFSSNMTNFVESWWTPPGVHLEYVEQGKVLGMENAAIIKLFGDELLNSPNWMVWCKQMYTMLQLCKVYEYMQGEVQKPNTLIDPQGARNWSKNDNYTKHLLTLNISTTEMMNLG